MLRSRRRSPPCRNGQALCREDRARLPLPTGNKRHGAESRFFARDKNAAPLRVERADFVIHQARLYRRFTDGVLGYAPPRSFAPYDPELRLRGKRSHAAQTKLWIVWRKG